MDGDVGDTSIASCLSSALTGLPEVERLVEVRYHGLHMGTFKKIHVLECTEEVAAGIAATYGMLTHH
jgi:hypothetical protein